MRSVIRRRIAQSQDEGFTLVEIILAMFIVVSVMTAVLGVMVSTLSTLAQARQRQSGSALATESLESLRALPYATVTSGAAAGCDASLGLSATSTYVTVVGATKTFTPPASLVPGPAEQLIVNTQSPCARTVTQGATTYTVLQYVTVSSTSDGFNLTSIATWKKHNGAVTSSVERSQTFSPAGCLLDTLHPFSGPCQAAFSARGSSDTFSLTVTQVDPLDPSIVLAEIGVLTLPAVSSGLEVEQTVSLTSTAVGAGAQDAAGSGVVTSRVQEANSDPTSGSLRSYAVTDTVPGGSLSPTPAAFSASSSSTELAGDVAANTTVCAMPTATGTLAVSTGPTGELRPCGRAKVSGPGNATATLSGQSLLAVDGVAGRAAGASIAGGTTAGVCGSAAAGCARSTVVRTVDLLSFVPGVGTSGLLKIDTLKEYAVSEKGAGAGSPSATRSGNLSLWNGSAYVPVTLSPTSSGTWSWGAAPSTFPAITSPGGLSITGALTVTPAGATTTGPATCDEAACVTTQKSGSITGSFLITSPDGVFRVDLAIGGVSAVAGYQAAPVG